MSRRKCALAAAVLAAALALTPPARAEEAPSPATIAQLINWLLSLGWNGVGDPVVVAAAVVANGGVLDEEGSAADPNGRR